jgi:signal transduction histidine kinase
VRTLKGTSLILAKDRETKNKFISFASHEIKKVITSVKWGTKVLLDEDLGPLTKEQKEVITTLHSQSNVMVRLTNDFLDVSKIELNKLELFLKPLQLDTVKRSIEKQLINTIARAQIKKITLNYAIQLDRKLSIHGDVDRINQIIENLIENAIRYTDPGGNVTVSVTNDDRQFLFNITDTGIGIEEKDKAKIFNDFFRAEEAKKMQPNGSGIGLYLAKRYIVGHGGSIWFTTKKNKGTTFTFTIPISRNDMLEEVFRTI